MTSPDLTAFLAARLRELAAISQASLDAAINRGQPPRRPGAWHTPGEDPGMPSSFELHFEPEAILLDTAAMQAILAEHEHVAADRPDRAAGIDFGCRTCHNDPDCGETGAHGWCKTTRHLAAPHAHHPEFKPEWSLT